MSFGDAEYAGKRKKTRREIFLVEMDQVVPWKSLLNLIEPCYPMACRGTIDHRQRQQHVLQPVALSERPLSTAPNDNKGSGVPVGSWREQSLPASAPDGNECQVPERS